MKLRKIIILVIMSAFLIWWVKDIRYEHKKLNWGWHTYSFGGKSWALQSVNTKTSVSISLVKLRTNEFGETDPSDIITVHPVEVFK